MSDRNLSRIFMDERKGGARNVEGSSDSNPSSQSLNQVSLSRPQFTDEGNHVPWSQETTDSLP